jgi:hypothetical protein
MPLVTPPLETKAPAPALNTVSSAVPADRIVIESPAVSVTPLLMTPELTAIATMQSAFAVSPVFRVYSLRTPFFYRIAPE